MKRILIADIIFLIVLLVLLGFQARSPRPTPTPSPPVKPTATIVYRINKVDLRKFTFDEVGTLAGKYKDTSYLFDYTKRGSSVHIKLYDKYKLLHGDYLGPVNVGGYKSGDSVLVCKVKIFGPQEEIRTPLTNCTF